MLKKSVKKKMCYKSKNTSTCEFDALTTWGELPEAGTDPLRGRFLLVTEAQEKV